MARAIEGHKQTFVSKLTDVWPARALFSLEEVFSDFCFEHNTGLYKKTKKNQLGMNVAYNLRLFQIFPGLIFLPQTFPVGQARRVFFLLVCLFVLFFKI